MYKQMFRYIRYVAKWLSLPFVLAAVFLFIIQFLPSVIGTGIIFWIFIVAGMFWALDTLWGTLTDACGIANEIKEHRQNRISAKLVPFYV
jgi:hypothetical protein